MSDSSQGTVSADDDGSRKRAGKKKLLLFVGVPLVGLAAGAGAVMSGVLDPLLERGQGPAASAHHAVNITMLPVAPIIVPVQMNGRSATVRLTIQIETTAEAADQAQVFLPRIADVLNGYLRAVDPSVIAEPAAFEHTRAAILRRAKLVAGNDLVRDVLIQELLVI
jgi:flagellar protein FliL